MMRYNNLVSDWISQNSDVLQMISAPVISHAKDTLKQSDHAAVSELQKSACH